MSYWYGSVRIVDPAFVKAGNSLPDEDTKPSVRPEVLKPGLKVRR